MTTNNAKGGYFVLALIAIVALAGLVALMQPKDDPSTRLGKAVEEVGEGLEDAGRELDPNRSAGEKVGDAIEDLGDSVEDATHR